MLQTIRERATGWIAYIIIGLLIIPFALWGINQYFSGSGALEAAEVGDSSISLQEFQRAYQQQQRQFSQLSPDILKSMVLQQLINERLLLEAADRQGLRVSDQQLSEAVKAIPAFQDEKGFTLERYRQVLRSQGFSESAFEESLRRSLRVEQLQEGLVNSAAVTPAELDRIVELVYQQRELNYVVLPLAIYLAKTTIDEAAVQAYYQEHKDRLLSPEQIQVRYVELKLEQMADEVSVSEAEAQAAYQEQIAKYTQPEERSASHILITLAADAGEEELDKARARAKSIYDEIASGAKSFEQVLETAQASEVRDIQGGQLGVVRKGMYPDAAFESALYTLKSAGDISEPVQTSFGFHIIRLDAITPERTKSFAEVRDEVTRELRLHKAESRFYEATEILANLSHEHPDSLQPAAEALKLTVQESQWFTRQGGEGIAAYPKVVEAAFSEEVLKRGFNSEPLEAQPNQLIVLRMQAHKEAAPRSLEEAREDIVNQLRSSGASEALAKDTEALLRRAAEGEALPSLAKEYGGELKEPGLVGRSDKAVDSALINEAFRLPKPEAGKISVGTAVLENGDRAVVAVSRVESGKVAALQEADRKALAKRLADQIGSAQFQGYLAALRAQTRIVAHSDRL